MSLDLFAGIPVSDLAVSTVWYEKLLGAPAVFRPNDIEVVWKLDDNRYLYIEYLPVHAGHAMHSVFVDDFNSRMALVAERGLKPLTRETYDNGVRKAVFRDPDGNRIGFGGGGKRD